MNIYLAASWSRRDEMRALTAELEREIPGLKVSSQWVTEPTGLAGELRFLSRKMNASRRARALQDRDNIYASDILVRFTDDLSAKMVPSHLATGSRMGEMMVALERSIPVIVVGGKQCIFDYLPEVQHVKNVAALKRHLRQCQKLQNVQTYGKEF